MLLYLIYLRAEKCIKYTILSLDPPNMTLQLTSGLEPIVCEPLKYVRVHKTITCDQVFLTRQKFMSLKILFNMSIYYSLFSSSTVNNLHSTRLFCSFPHCALLLHPSLSHYFVLVNFFLLSQ